MRVDCKNYESRTYRSGDTVRMCRIDLAPEAPWRCPADCPGYERKLADGGWTHGSLVTKAPGGEPPPLDDHTISLLDQAEDIVNAAGPGIVSEVGKARKAVRRQPGKQRRWWPFGGR